MSDLENIQPDPENPMSIFDDRPVGQTVKVFMGGHTGTGQTLELNFALTMPDNAIASESGARKLGHQTWHMIAGQPEPEVETYDIEGEADEELAQATIDALKAEAERQKQRQEAFMGFLEKVNASKPKETDPRWN